MSFVIKVTLPDGTAVETETAAEAAMLLTALNPAPKVVLPPHLTHGRQDPQHQAPRYPADIPVSLHKYDPEQDKPRRTRKVVRNWELDVLDAWLPENPDWRDKKAVAELGRRLGRTVPSVLNLVRRYKAGVYSVSSAKADDPAKYDVTQDPSRGESK